MEYLRILMIMSFCIILNHPCDAYTFSYDQVDEDENWLYNSDLYGQEYRQFVLSEDFDDYVLPNTYHKYEHYPPIEQYPPSTYYIDSSPQLDIQWNDDTPTYLTYQRLPNIQKEPVYFAPPSTEKPTPTPPPSSPTGYHYPTPETKYLPPNKRPIIFSEPKNPEAPKSVYLPPTKKSTTEIPKTTTTPPTPKSLYLPPIIVAEPSKPKIESQYLPPLRYNLQPPPISSTKPIRFY